MKFAHPEALYILPAVWAVIAWAMHRSGKRRLLLLRKFAGAQFAPLTNLDRRGRADRFLFFILITALYVTLARPMYFAKDDRNELRGAPYLVALDASRSMLANDVEPNRYAAASIALDRFFAESKGDHVGLITFAGVAYMNAPLTFDMTALRAILTYIDPNELSDPGSSISSALDRAGRFFRSNSIPERTLIIISDGEDLDGNAVNFARKLHREEGVTIHTIGVGSATGGPIAALRGDTYQTNSIGRVVVTKLDENNLRRIANAAGGSYHQLGHNGDGLKELRARVLEPLAEKLARNDLQNYHEAYYVPLVIAILALVARVLLNAWRRKNIHALALPAKTPYSSEMKSLALLTVLALSIRAELFVSSHDNSRVLRYSETTGALIDVFIPNSDQRLQFPHGLAFGRDNNLYVASAGNDSVLRYNGQTGAFIDAFVTSGAGDLDYPVALIFRNQYLYVSSQLNDRVLRYNAITGAFVDTFVLPTANLDGPSDMAFGADNNLYVVGRFNHRVVRYFGSNGAFDRVFVSSDLAQPFGIRFLPFSELPESRLLVASGNNNSVQSFGTFTGAFIGVYANTNLSFPIGITLGPDQNVYVASYGNDRVVRFDGRTGSYIDDFIGAGTGGLDGPNFMAFRPAEPPGLSISRTQEGAVISWPSKGAGEFELFQASAVSFANEVVFIGSTSMGAETNSASVAITSEGAFFRLKKP